MTTGNSGPWEIAGFDCAREPERLLFRPNARRLQDAEANLLSCCIQMGVFSPLLLVCLWMMLSMGGTVSVPWFCGIVLGIGIPAGIAVYVAYKGHMRDRLNPVVLDRSTDRLLFGSREICRLSDIKQVWLRRIDSDPSRLSYYSVGVTLKDGRTIPRDLSHRPRYPLGPQEHTVEGLIRDVADFIGAKFGLTTETAPTAVVKGGPMGMGVL